MQIGKKLILMFVILCCCVSCDRITKEIAKQSLPEAMTIYWLNDAIQFHYTENPGAFLSFGGDFSQEVRFWLFIVLPGLTLIALPIWLLCSQEINTMSLLSLSLIMGGGIGNLIDRIFQNGKVTDFLVISIGPLRTGIFNAADVMIMLGAIGFIIFGLFPWKKPHQPTLSQKKK